MQNEKMTSDSSPQAEAALIQLDGEQDAVAVADPERGVGAQSRDTSATTTTAADTPNGKASVNGAKLPRATAINGTPSAQPMLASRLPELVDLFSKSEMAQATKDEIERARTGAPSNGHGVQQALALHSYQRASWWTQFTILSGRSFKNLYRNPMLMWSHYAVAVIVACESTDSGAYP